MGCGQSKQDHEIAANFFEGAKEAPSAQLQKDSTRSAELRVPQTPQNSARSSQQQQDSTRSQESIPIPSSPRQHSQSHIEQPLSPRSTKVESTESSHNGSSSQLNNVVMSPESTKGKQGKKSEFVAPPSSTSFYKHVIPQTTAEEPSSRGGDGEDGPSSTATPAPPPPLPEKTHGPKPPAPPPLPEKTHEPPKPPAPTASMASTASSSVAVRPRGGTGPGGAPRGSFKPQPNMLDGELGGIMPPKGPGGAPRGSFKPQPNMLDGELGGVMPPPKNKPAPSIPEDDDFSVAPSLQTKMRSIIGHNFDDVYLRGKKVRYLSDIKFVVPFYVCANWFLPFWV